MGKQKEKDADGINPPATTQTSSTAKVKLFFQKARRNTFSGSGGQASFKPAEVIAGRGRSLTGGSTISSCSSDSVDPSKCIVYSDDEERCKSIAGSPEKNASELSSIEEENESRNAAEQSDNPTRSRSFSCTR